MDNQNQETTSAKNSSSKAVTTVVVLFVLVVIAAGGYFWYHSKKTAVEGTMTENEKNEYVMKPSQEVKPSNMLRKGKGMDMKPQPTPTITTQQTQEIASGTAKTTTEKTFHINGGNFYLVPNNIAVNKGDKVTFVFTDDGGFHDVVIDEFGFKTDLLKKVGEQTTATFTADKAGSFVYYCDVGQHRKLGMMGTLTVK
jgi:plastocyanin